MFETNPVPDNSMPADVVLVAVSMAKSPAAFRLTVNTPATYVSVTASSRRSSRHSSAGHNDAVGCQAAGAVGFLRCGIKNESERKQDRQRRIAARRRRTLRGEEAWGEYQLKVGGANCRYDNPPYRPGSRKRWRNGLYASFSGQPTGLGRARFVFQQHAVGPAVTDFHDQVEYVMIGQARDRPAATPTLIERLEHQPQPFGQRGLDDRRVVEKQLPLGVDRDRNRFAGFCVSAAALGRSSRTLEAAKEAFNRKIRNNCNSVSIIGVMSMCASILRRR